MNNNCLNKKWAGAAATLGALLCAISLALGQPRQPAGQSAGRNIALPTPAQKARLNEMYRLDAAAAALDAGRYAEAEDAARQAVSVGHDSGLAEEYLAAALDAQGKTQEALQAYKTIYDEGDTFARNELPYALLLLKTGHWAEAVEAYNRQLPYCNAQLLADKPFSPDVPQPKELEAAIHIGLGLSEDWRGYNWKLHSHEQVLPQFQQALALEPDSAAAHFYYGRALERAGRWAEAKAAFQKAASLGEGNVKAAAEQEMRGR